MGAEQSFTVFHPHKAGPFLHFVQYIEKFDAGRHQLLEHIDDLVKLGAILCALLALQWLQEIPKSGPRWQAILIFKECTKGLHSRLYKLRFRLRILQELDDFFGTSFTREVL